MVRCTWPAAEKILSSTAGELSEDSSYLPFASPFHPLFSIRLLEGFKASEGDELQPKNYLQ